MRTRREASLLCFMVGSALLATIAAAGVKATGSEAALNGVWRLATPPFTELKDAQGNPPPLNAAGATLYTQRKSLLARGDSTFDLSRKCKPMGFPRVLWDGGPFDMQVVTGEQVFQGYTFNRNHRVIVDWGTDLPRLQIPRYYGTSAAHWEGTTLVIRSGLYNDSALLDASGLPLGEDLQLEERYVPGSDGKTLEVRLRITDSKFYQRPWEASVRFERVPDGRIEEDVCQERSEFYRELMKGRGKN